MIISWLTGGLGNQMFQYAAGLALAHRRRTVLKLDVSWFREDPEFEDHNRYSLGCFNISEQFATREEVDRLRGLAFTKAERLAASVARRLHFYRYAKSMERHGTRHSPTDFAFDPGFFDLPDETYLEGMWQSEKFFAPIADLVRLQFSFRYPASAAVEATLRQIESGPSAAVHFRRGDYLSNPGFARGIGAIDLDYYHRALEVLRERHPGLSLYVFSDDIDAVEKEFRPAERCHFVRATGRWNSFDKIRMMSHCDHAIIANSTFSWWAAWLNPSPTKTVIAPEPWFAEDALRGRDVVPDSWMRIGRSSNR